MRANIEKSQAKIDAAAISKPNGKHASKPFPVHALADLSPEAQPEIVQGLLAERSVNVIAGLPNAGKTFFGVDLGVHVAASAQWFGRKVHGGPVIYVGAEAPGSVKLRARTVALEKFPGQRLPFYVVTAAPALGDAVAYLAEAERLLATIREVESELGESVKLVIIDTLASVLGSGEENGTGMSLITTCAKYLVSHSAAAVVLIHHPSKNDAASLRGHSSLSAGADAIIIIASDEFSGVRTATLIKSRDSQAGAQVHFLLEVITLLEADSFGDPRTTCIIKAAPTSALPRKRPTGKWQEKLLDELERRHRTGETSWDRATVTKAGRDLGMHRNTSPTACAGLLKAGFLQGSDAQLFLKYPPT